MYVSDDNSGVKFYPLRYNWYYIHCCARSWVAKINSLFIILATDLERNIYIGDDDMTKEEFEQEFCKQSEIDINYYQKHFVTLPCRGCGYEKCNGWAAVCNDDLSIKTHQELYGGTTK